MDGLRRVQDRRERITEAVAPANCPVGTAGLVVGYSGGPDSTALLHALAHAGYSVPVRAIHVCHNLQPEAAQWAVHCRAFCARLGIDFECSNVQVEQRGAGIEAAARRVRYAAFEDALKPGETLVLAHHADDQAETFVLQALRGAGVAGLAGMPERTAFGRGWLWRPLLAVRRRALRDYAQAQTLDWVTDPSNQDTGLDRGYFREAVKPVIEQRWPSAADTLSRAAHWCAEADALVLEVAAEDAAALMDADRRLEVAGLARLSSFRQGNVLRHWLARGGFDAPDHRHVAQIRRLLTAREHSGPAVTWGQTQVRLFDGCLYALPPLPLPPGDWQTQWDLREPLELPDGCGELRAQADGEPRQAVTVCFRRGGERYVDARRGGTRTLKSFLQDARIPPWQRERLPLIFSRGQLVAIADKWLDPVLADQLGLDSLRLIWRQADEQ